MTVSLYKGCKVDNRTKMGLWSTLDRQRNYFDSLEKYNESVQTVKLGQPLSLRRSIKDLLDYNYGSIDYGDGFRFYFSIDDLEMTTETITEVHYTIDCYETLVKQKPFRFGRANISRYPTRLGKFQMSYDPSFTMPYDTINRSD